MKIKAAQSVSNAPDFENLRKWTANIFESIISTINGRISFTDNCQVSLVDVTFPDANTDVPVTHGLGIIPNGYLVAGRPTNIQVFDGTVNSTTQVIFLQASAAGSAKILIF